MISKTIKTTMMRGDFFGGDNSSGGSGVSGGGEGEIGRVDDGVGIGGGGVDGENGMSSL
jgi:hypothetical protein